MKVGVFHPPASNQLSTKVGSSNAVRRLLSAPTTRTFRFQSVTPLILDNASEKQRTGVELLRLGSYQHPQYGQFDVTVQTFTQLIQNFNANVFGQKIFIDVAHEPEDGAAAEIIKIYQSGEWLLCDIELTPYGMDAIVNRKFIYLSADYSDAWLDPATGRQYGAVLFGAGLTIRPFIKHQSGILLSENTRMNKYLQKLLASLKAKNASEALTKTLSDSFAAEIADEHDEKKLSDMVVRYEALADDALAQIKQLADSHPNTTPVIQLNSGLSVSDVERLLADRDQKQEQDRANRARKLSDNQAILTAAINAAEGLSEETRKTLAETALPVVTAEMTVEQVKLLADAQIKMGDQLEVQRQLAAQGFQRSAPHGTVHITVDESNTVKRLQDEIDKRLGLSNLPDAQRFRATGGKLNAANQRLAEQALALYDAQHAAQLHRESKQLADAGSNISDVAVPAVYERTVLREALYRLIGLQFVNAGVCEFSDSWYVPYSYRKATAAGVADTRIYEGQSIQRAGVVQTGETAYPIPQKLSFEVTDELRYLTGARRLDWEAVTENQTNATRIIGEDTDRLIFNEQLQAADEYQAIPVANENLAAQITGGKKVAIIGGVMPTTVCRPRKIYGLQGNPIGNVQNPIVVTYDGVVRQEFAAGVSAGIYYVLDYHIGEIYLVDQTGVLIDPAGKTWAISYSKVSNCAYFDVDLPAGTKDADYWDKFLRVFALRKTLLEDSRYYSTGFGLMSGNVQALIEQAQKFAANYRVPATELDVNGNLGRIKDVPCFKTSAPGLWQGDRRVLLGESNVSRFRIAKPWTMGTLENQKDAQGKFTGKKEAYGDQFLFLHTPTQLKGALTSIVLYSSSARVARAVP